MEDEADGQGVGPTPSVWSRQRDRLVSARYIPPPTEAVRMSAYIAWMIVPIAVIVIVLLAIEWYRGRKREEEDGDD